MKTLLFSAFATPAWAQSQGYTNRICVDILTNFVDADYTGPVTAGDFWVQNGPRPARGVQILVSDDVQTLVYNVGNDGCITVATTQTNPLHPFFLVQVISRAEVNGVEIEATDGASYDHLSCTNGTNCPGLPDIVNFQVGYVASDTTLTISNGDQRWNLIAVAMWAMHRNMFGLGTFSTRGCCLETDSTIAGSFDLVDGTCVNDPSHQYRHTWGASQGVTEIEMFSNAGGASRRTWLDGNGDEQEEPAVGVTAARRFHIAHELGHVIVAKRMGDFTDRSGAAPDEFCKGTYNAQAAQEPVGDGLPTVPVPEDVSPKGALTKEYQSMAAREGWATFFAVWLFNRRTQSDGQMDFFAIHDVDRDGYIDNDYDADTSDTSISFTEEAMGDGILDMGVDPVLVTPAGHPPVAQHAVGRDWLEHLVNANDAPGGNPSLGCVGELGNRGTEYDWARFFWQMTQTTEGDIRPEDLADLYVDMCPTNWVSVGDLDPVQPPLPWPIVRLEQSAIHQGATVETEWNARKNWGMDH